MDFFQPVEPSPSFPIRMPGGSPADNPGVTESVPIMLQSLSVIPDHPLAADATVFSSSTEAKIFMTNVIRMAHLKYVPYLLLEMEMGNVPHPRRLWPLLKTHQQITQLRYEVWVILFKQTNVYLKGLSMRTTSSDYKKIDLKYIAAAHVALAQFYNQGDLDSPIFQSHPLLTIVSPLLPAKVPAVTPPAPALSPPPVASVHQPVSTPVRTEYLGELLTARRQLSDALDSIEDFKDKLSSTTSDWESSKRHAKQWARKAKSLEETIEAKDAIITTLRKQLEEKDTAMSTDAKLLQENQKCLIDSQSDLSLARVDLDATKSQLITVQSQLREKTETTTRLRGLLCRGRECPTFFKHGRCDRICTLWHTIRRDDNPTDVRHDVRTNGKPPTWDDQTRGRDKKRPREPSVEDTEKKDTVSSGHEDEMDCVN